jgi:hypothetical protein
VSEIGNLGNLEFKDGLPAPPNLTTVNINLTGVLYSRLDFVAFAISALTSCL